MWLEPLGPSVESPKRASRRRSGKDRRPHSRDAWRATAFVSPLQPRNPKGYWSTHLVHVGELLIDLDMQAYITSMGKHVVIEACRT